MKADGSFCGLHNYRLLADVCACDNHCTGCKFAYGKIHEDCCTCCRKAVPVALPDVKVGQVWADNDPRSEGRTLQVVGIEEGRAVCVVLTNDNDTQAVLDGKAYSLVLTGRDRRGTITRINRRRFVETRRGYKLLRQDPYPAAAAHAVAISRVGRGEKP